jgi:hypothetical protein
MGILNEKMQIDTTGFAKYSPLFPLNTDDGSRLGKALRLSREFISKAYDHVLRLDAMRLRPAALKGLLKKSEHDQVVGCLHYHFGLRSNFSKESLVDISSVMKTIREELSGAVILKDARVLLIIDAIKEASPGVFAALRNPGDASDDLADLMAEFGISSDGPSEEDRADDRLYTELAPIYGELSSLDDRETRRFWAEKGKYSKVLGNSRIRAGVSESLVGKTLNQAGHVRPKKRVGAELTIEDQKNMEGNYDVPKLNMPGARSNVHINFGTIKDRSIEFLACAIIHETSHKVAFTHDHAYAFKGDLRYQSLPSDLKMKNADSYAMAASSIGLGRLCANHDDLD